MERKAFTVKMKTKVIKHYGWKRHQKVSYELRDYMTGKLHPIFISNNRMNTNSNPAAWLHAFCQDKLLQEEKSFQRFCVTELAAFLNLNASLHNAGNMTYDTFANFTSEEIERKIGIYTLNGLSLPPALGPNTMHCHKEFKKLFCVGDPRIVTPSCSTHPNFKVDCWLKHVNEKFMEAWKLSSNISCDKQTQGFQ
eukprot:11663483-Ditylum_brightwellii.AAC.1